MIESLSRNWDRSIICSTYNHASFHFRHKKDRCVLVLAATTVNDASIPRRVEVVEVVQVGQRRHDAQGAAPAVGNDAAVLPGLRRLEHERHRARPDNGLLHQLRVHLNRLGGRPASGIIRKPVYGLLKTMQRALWCCDLCVFPHWY